MRSAAAGAVVAALAVSAMVPALLGGAPSVRFRPCPEARGASCARVDGMALRIDRAPGTAPVGVPGRMLAVLGSPPGGAPARTGRATLTVTPAARTPDALALLGRRAAVMAAGADTVPALGMAARAQVDGLILVDPPAAPPAGPPVPVSALVVRTGNAAGPGAVSVRTLVVRRRSGTPDECTMMAVIAFARDPLTERPALTDCR